MFKLNKYLATDNSKMKQRSCCHHLVLYKTMWREGGRERNLCCMDLRRGLKEENKGWSDRTC